jgi:hypothetical protein
MHTPATTAPDTKDTFLVELKSQLLTIVSPWGLDFVCLDYTPYYLVLRSGTTDSKKKTFRPSS